MEPEPIFLTISLLLSGFFSSAETALFSIDKIKAIHLSRKGSKRGALILRMKKDPHTLLTTILIGNNIVNIGASAIATSLAISHFKSNAVGIVTGIMTLLILIFGEIFPKSFATHNNVFVSKLVIYPLYWLSKIVFPIIYILNFIPKLTGTIDTSKETVTEDELMTMVEVVEEDGEIKEEEKEYITNIFDFDDTHCHEIMTPRADMFVIDASKDMDVEKIIRSGYSRIPVIENSIDNIIGILHLRDLFLSFHRKAAQYRPCVIDVKKIMKQPYFIPESKKLDALLNDFKQKKNHIAIIVDEYGGVSGIVTLEDVVEEIFGDIFDESDTVVPDILKLKENKWRVSGKIDIEHLNREIPIEIPDSQTYDTFSGYILEKLDRLPKPGDAIQLGNFSAMVKDMDGNRIHHLILVEGQEKRPAPAE